MGKRYKLVIPEMIRSIDSGLVMEISKTMTSNGKLISDAVWLIFGTSVKGPDYCPIHTGGGRNEIFTVRSEWLEEIDTEPLIVVQLTKIQKLITEVLGEINKTVRDG